MSQLYYPSLGSIFNEEDLPGALSFLLSGGTFTSFLNKLFFRSLDVQIGSNGVERSIYLEIVTRKELSYEIPGTDGMKIGLNLDDFQANDISVFPISIEYDWPIRAILKNFNATSFGSDALNYLNAAVDIYSISKEEIISLCIQGFISSPDEVKQFAKDYNTEYGINISENYTGAQNDTDIAALISDIELNSTTSDQRNFYKVCYELYVKDSQNDFSQTLENIDILFSLKTGKSIVQTITEFLLPYASASVKLTLSLEFPRSILLPMKQVNGEYQIETDETKKVRLDFAEADLFFDTKGTLSFDSEIAATMAAPYNKAQIGKTGFSISLTGAKVDISDSKNIPEADFDGRPSDFKGVYIENLAIGFPEGWALKDGNAPPELSGSRLLIGSPGGFSGELKLAGVGGGSVLDFDVLGTTISFDSFSLVLSQNFLCRSIFWVVEVDRVEL